jgi:hypothetical protein
MYTQCNQQIQRPPNNLKERKNNERRVRGIRNPLIMMEGETLINEKRGIRATCVRKTTRPTYVLGLQRPKFL